MQPRFWILALMILLPVGSRLGIRAMYEGWNFVPMGAIALFAGAYLRPLWMAVAVPLIAMFISDLGIGIMLGDLGAYTFHAGMPLIYGCYAINVRLLGCGIRWYWDGIAARQSGKLSWLQQGLPVFTGALAGSVIFFLVSNLAPWVQMYPLTLAGLKECYVMALPFYRATLTSDLIFTPVLFFGWAWLRSVNPSLEETVQLSPRS